MTDKLTQQGDPRILGNGDIFDHYKYSDKVQNYYNRYMSGEKVPANWIKETDYDADLKAK